MDHKLQLLSPLSGYRAYRDCIGIMEKKMEGNYYLGFIGFRLNDFSFRIGEHQDLEPFSGHVKVRAPL